MSTQKSFHGPDLRLEELQMVIKVDFIIRAFSPPSTERLLELWRQDCPRGVALGEHWFRENTLQHAREKKENMRVISNRIARELNRG